MRIFKNSFPLLSLYSISFSAAGFFYLYLANFSLKKSLLLTLLIFLILTKAKPYIFGFIALFFVIIISLLLILNLPILAESLAGFLYIFIVFGLIRQAVEFIEENYEKGD